MLCSLSLLPLIGIFTVAAVAIWMADIRLSNTTDVLSRRLGLGQALGVILAGCRRENSIRWCSAEDSQRGA